MSSTDTPDTPTRDQEDANAPDSPDSPGIVQPIVDIYERRLRFTKAAAQEAIDVWSTFATTLREELKNVERCMHQERCMCYSLCDDVVQLRAENKKLKLKIELRAEIDLRAENKLKGGKAKAASPLDDVTKETANQL